MPRSAEPTAQSVSPMMAAVTVPSRAIILTGRTLFRCPEQPKGDHALWRATFADAAGYQTMQVGKWHNGGASLNLAFQDNRSSFLGGMTDPSKAPIYDRRNPTGRYARALARPSGKHAAEVFADAAVAFLAARDKSRPFFLWCAFTTPHDPRNPPAEYAAMSPADDTATALIVAEALHGSAKADAQALVASMAQDLAAVWPIEPTTAILTSTSPRFDF